MERDIVELVATNRAAILIVLGFVLLIFAKPLLWWLFSFDDRVAAVLAQKKSSEVRTGKIVETMAPFLEQFPVDIKKPGTSTVFIGQPIDFIHFDPAHGISFIEVKSGGARLSDSQRQLKELVERGAVTWHTVQVDGLREEEEPPLPVRRRR